MTYYCSHCDTHTQPGQQVREDARCIICGYKMEKCKGDGFGDTNEEIIEGYEKQIEHFQEEIELRKSAILKIKALPEKGQKQLGF